ncbi:hypothetical protein K1T71_000285 [Dendrolimus kikuchii]|uniref:Uncharacterized protein n=1 Tax=Dendrolimus kikuchii TaxID=765133 RepID=A0ACC1DKC5_9NEOP|nr:hypothetical protein K1T71_000285 [Dendrolimus kikuchii]
MNGITVVVHFSGLKMLRWLLVWQLRFLLVRGIFDTSFFTMKRQSTLSEVNCIDFSKINTNTNRLGRIIPVSRHMDATTMPQNKIIGIRRFDRMVPDTDDIVREHAKLVQDINSLRQLVFVSPLTDSNRDYDDSIFHEIIETASTTTARPGSYGPLDAKPTKASSIPVILLGGASQQQLIKRQPMSPIKPSFSLVGTTITRVKHPYPFVMQPSRIPIKVCITPVPITYSAATTRKPSVWEKLLKTILPR